MKRNMKKILALLLAVAMIATTVSVDGIRSLEEAQAATIGIQPDESFDKITFSDFGIQDATYADGANQEGRAKGRDTLNKTVIRGEVYVGSISNKLQFFLGNKDHAWGGLAVEILSATDMTVAWGNGYGLSSDIAGVDFVGEKFNLMMSLELVNNDNGGELNDLKVGVWFNGVLYNQEYFYFNNVGAQFGNYFLVWSHGQGDSITIDSVYEKPDENFDRITFEDFNIPDGTYANGANKEGTANGRATLDKTVICGDVYVESLSNKLQFFWGNKEHAWAGVAVEIVSENEMRVGWSHTGVTNFLESDIAGVKFVGEKFNLMMSAELVDHDDSDGTPDDLKVGVWFNGVLYNQEYFYFDNAKDNFGNYFLVWSHGSGDSITIDSVYEKPDESFDRITFADFNIPDGTYADGANKEGTPNGRATLDKTVICGDVYVESLSNKLQFFLGNKEHAWGGLAVEILSATKMTVAWGTGNELSSEIAGVDFVGEKFNLMMSLELVDHDSDGTPDDLKLGMWFNGVLYNQEYFYFNNVKDNFGNYFLVWSHGSGDSITIGSNQPNETFDKITYGHFEIADGTYPYNPGELAVQGKVSERTTLDKTVLYGDILVQGGDNNEIIWGGVGPWNGLRMKPSSDGTMEMKWMNSHDRIIGDVITLQSSTAGVDFHGQEYSLMMSAEVINNDKDVFADDLKLGLWFNGRLYNQEYFILEDVGTIFGNHLSAWCPSEGDSVTLGSEQPDENFDKITFAHFGILDGTYSYNGDLVVKGTASGKKTLDKTVISGDIQVEGSDNTEIIWGGVDTGWNGLRMKPKSDGTMEVKWMNASDQVVGETYTLQSKIAGVDFLGEKYNLMMSAEQINGGNDVKIGIWFNGALYNQQYFVISNVGTIFGNYFSVWCASEGNKVTFGSEQALLEQPNKDFEWITYSLFGVDDGKYEYNNGNMSVDGTYRKADTLNKTVICGDVEFSGTSGFQYIIGGTDEQDVGIWKGISLNVDNANQMRIVWWHGGDNYIGVDTLSSTAAGVDFIGDSFNLMTSIEVTDADGDGTNDVKLGIWFDGLLYKQTYYVISGVGDYLGGRLGVYVPNQGDYVVLNSMEEYAQRPNSEFDKITFSDFGLETSVCESTVEASASKYADKKFDKVVFSGDLRLSDAGNHTITYGGTSGENGLKLSITSASDASLVWVYGGQQQTIGSFTAANVGLTSFTQQAFNLKISTELIDNGSDGNKNDIKVGIWFNDVLLEIAGNEYAIISNLGDSLGNYINIKVATGTSVLIRNDAEYQANPYYYEEIAEYRSPNVAPEAPEGYVFGGWYADAEYTEWLGTEIVSGDAWAKFVEEDVLTAKPQIKLTKDTDGNVIVPTDSTSLRLATTVDNLLYRRISFYLSKETAIDSDTYNEKEFNTATTDENGRMVYEKLYYIGENKDTTTGTESYKPTIFSWQSDYFKTFTLTGIPASDYKLNIKVVPYWITMDGTEVRGKELITCVADYVPGTNKSEAVSVDFLGEYTMPITGYHGPNRATNTADTMLFPDTVTDEYFKMVADAGVNVIIGTNLDYAVDPELVKDALALGEKYGIGIYVKDSSIYKMTTADAVKAQISNYSSSKSFAGMFIVDEPGTASFLAKTENGYAPDYTLLVGILEDLGITYYANMYPIVDADKEWWENILGSQGINDTDKEAYKTYIDEFNKALNTKMMSYDYYPFDEKRKNDSDKYDLSLYFWNMATIREQAQLLNKPFWAYVQAGSQWNDDQAYITSTTPYYPSESQFNWNVNTSLAFGAQGIQYFPLVQVTYYAYGSDATHWDFERNGLIGAWGNKTQWYDYAQDANAHIAAIDSVLMNSYSEQIIASGSAQSDTSGLTDVTTDASYGVLKTVSGDALVGYFDYCGKTALYVVNYQMFDAGKATTTQNVTLSFDSAHNITKIENAETTKTSANTLTLTMEPGEGILLVIE